MYSSSIARSRRVVRRSLKACSRSSSRASTTNRVLRFACCSAGACARPRPRHRSLLRRRRPLRSFATLPGVPHAAALVAKNEIDNFVINSASRCVRALWACTVDLEVLGQAGWTVPLSECVWCTTAPDEKEFSLTLDDCMIERRMRAAGFEALGAQLTFDNCFSVELHCRRLSTNTVSFWSVRPPR